MPYVVTTATPAARARSIAAGAVAAPPTSTPSYDARAASGSPPASSSRVSCVGTREVYARVHPRPAGELAASLRQNRWGRSRLADPSPAARCPRAATAGAPGGRRCDAAAGRAASCPGRRAGRASRPPRPRSALTGSSAPFGSPVEPDVETTSAVGSSGSSSSADEPAGRAGRLVAVAGRHRHQRRALAGEGPGQRRAARPGQPGRRRSAAAGPRAGSRMSGYGRGWATPTAVSGERREAGRWTRDERTGPGAGELARVLDLGHAAARPGRGAPGVDAAGAALRPLLRGRRRARPSADLHHALAAGHVGHGLLGYLVGVLRHLVGLDELQLVRLGVRPGRRALPAADPGADGRRAGAGDRGRRGVRPTPTTPASPSAT